MQDSKFLDQMKGPNTTFQTPNGSAQHEGQRPGVEDMPQDHCKVTGQFRTGKWSGNRTGE